MPSTGIGRPGSPALDQSSLPSVGSSFRFRPRIWPLRPMTNRLLNKFPGQGLAFRMADETGDSQVGAQTGESTHPAIRLLGNPVGSDQRLEAIARHDQLTREHPVGA